MKETIFASGFFSGLALEMFARNDGGWALLCVLFSIVLALWADRRKR